MGEAVDPDEPTQSAGVLEAETQSVYAWGLADEPDEPEPHRLTPGRITTAAVAASLTLLAIAGALAWQHLRGEETSAATPATTSMVPATMTSEAPPSRPPLPSPPPVTVTTVIVQAPPVQVPPDEQVPPIPGGLSPAAIVPYDRQFIANLQAKHWLITDTSELARDAHVICALLQQGLSRGRANATYAEASGRGMVDADQFTVTAMQTYPGCP